MRCTFIRKVFQSLLNPLATTCSNRFLDISLSFHHVTLSNVKVNVVLLLPRHAFAKMRAIREITNASFRT
jgi:hypothetical protein